MVIVAANKKKAQLDAEKEKDTVQSEATSVSASSGGVYFSDAEEFNRMVAANKKKAQLDAEKEKDTVQSDATSVSASVSSGGDTGGVYFSDIEQFNELKKSVDDQNEKQNDQLLAKEVKDKLSVEDKSVNKIKLRKLKARNHQVMEER